MRKTKSASIPTNLALLFYLHISLVPIHMHTTHFSSYNMEHKNFRFSPHKLRLIFPHVYKLHNHCFLWLHKNGDSIMYWKNFLVLTIHIRLVLLFVVIIIPIHISEHGSFFTSVRCILNLRSLQWD